MKKLALVLSVLSVVVWSDAVSVGGESAVRLASACEGRQGWNEPAPPATIFANVHYVGTCGITVLLITSDDGHILIDGATEKAAPQIISNIEELGFDPSDVRIVLSSHEHIDHAGGIAEIQRRTGAQLFARQEAKGALERGLMDPSDPQVGLFPAFPAARVDKILSDGDVVRLGSLALTVHATKGHSSGSTSWGWTSCEAGECHSVVYADSLSAVSADGYRFSDHPDLVAAYRESFTKVRAMECGLLLTPHPSASHMFERFKGEAPMFERQACRSYADAYEQKLEQRLMLERE